MTAKVTRFQLIEDLRRLGVALGDCLLVRAQLGAVGRLDGGREAILDALLDAVGPEGTLVSLAFTESAFIKKPRKEDAFHALKLSYAGALPNMMISHKHSKRSRHPTCSYVALGRHAEFITSGHDEHAGAYEPVRRVMELRGKCMLIGCVGSSPGFTTAHLAEADLGLLDRAVLPRLRATYFFGSDGELKLYRRTDPGMCSSSFYKFYAHYVREEILRAGYVGSAYSILAAAQDSYAIEYSLLEQNPGFNVCDSNMCFTCNAGRWDRIHRAPLFFARLLAQKIRRARQ